MTTETEQFDCKHCERSFLLADTLETHLSNVHPDEAAYDFKLFKRKKKKGSGNERAAARTDAASAVTLRRAAGAGWRSGGFAEALMEQARSEVAAQAAKLPNQDAASLAVLVDTAVVTCRAHDCGRSFSGLKRLLDHAEAVHTFDDIRRMVSDEVREQYWKPGNYQASPPIPTVYVWVDDLSTDWVVFQVEEGGDSTLYKASYSILDRKVTLGEPVEVVRRTVYEPVNKSDDE